MISALTAHSLFQLDVSGERLRQLLSLRIVRLDAAIEREKQHAEHLRTVEKQNAARLRAIAEEITKIQIQHAGAHTAMEFAPDYPSIHKPASVRHDDNVRILQNALAEIRWLHDELHPEKMYQLNRGDLAIFGDFGVPGGLMSLAPMGEALA